MHIEKYKQSGGISTANTKFPGRGLSALAIALIVFSLCVLPSCSGKKDEIAGKGSGSGQRETPGSNAPTYADKEKILIEGVKNAKLVFETKDGNDLINVIVSDKVKDSASLRYQYEWTKNGEQVGTGPSVSGFKRGDKISVTITPADGDRVGKPKIFNMEVKNSTPKIVELKNVSADEKQVTYQVVGKDPDGDPVTYSLVDAAKGMTIDPKSGVLQWTLDPAAAAPQGDVTVNVKVVDGQGGELVYPLKIARQEMPAKADQQEKPAR